jgi:hypothetical protein
MAGTMAEQIFDKCNTDDELGFESIWAELTSPEAEDPGFQAEMQFAVVQNEIVESASYSLKEMFLWVHRMDYYRDSLIGRALILKSEQLEPRRATVAVLKTLNVLRSKGSNNVMRKDQPLCV